MPSGEQVTGLSNVASFKAKPGQSELLGAELLELVAPSRSEPGCLRYELYQANDDNHTWLVLENWRTPADFDHHMATPYVIAFLAKVPDLCGDDVLIRGYQHRSSPVTDTADALTRRFT